MPGRFTRRGLLAVPAAAVIDVPKTDRSHAPIAPAERPTMSTERHPSDTMIVSATTGPNALPFEQQHLGTVGVYDIDWLIQPPFTRLLDNLAASPAAFSGVRCFGVFTAGERELLAPDGGGTVWPRADAPIDFSDPFGALAELSSRGLTPVIALGFFPGAVSGSPVEPPTDWTAWKTLVRAFFTQLAADPRFGPAALRDWWFEVWNEPNEGRFWHGSVEDYVALYRATSEAITDTGLTVRLGGPAIAYKPQVDPSAGIAWIERFLRFVAGEHLPLDFVSFHRKGTVGDDPPDPRRLHEAAAAVAEAALAIDPVRFAGLTIVNDEADEKVGFEVPYPPRMDAHNPAWLAASAAIHASLQRRYAAAGMRFVAAADNANLQLVQAPFDGRRSLMTLARPGATADLLKVAAYGFYELVRLLRSRQAVITIGEDLIFPTTDLYALPTADDDGVAVLLAYYPNPDVAEPQARARDLVVRDIPWPRINVARFQIDHDHSNAYAAAGGSATNPYPVPDLRRLPEIRRAQEIATANPIARDREVVDGEYRESLTLAPFTTLCLWLTPVRSDAPAAPVWLAAEREEGNVILRWTANHEPFFYGYELERIQGSDQTERIAPEPLRAAMWVDTAPPSGSLSYAVRAISVSGVASDWVISATVGDAASRIP